MGMMTFWSLLISSSLIQQVVGDSCTYYGDYASLPVSVVTCSDHAPGLYSNSAWGYNSGTLIGQVSQLHNNGGLYATAWNSVASDGDAAHCLHCLKVTASNGKSVQVTVIDRKGAGGVDLSDAAFDCLFGAGAHVGGGNYAVTVQDLGAGPCANGGGCGATSAVTTQAQNSQGQNSNSQGGSCNPYVIVSGDTGWGIASKLGVDFNTQLSVWNPNVNWNTIQVGQTICGSAPTQQTTTTTKAPTTTTAPTQATGGGSCQTYTVVSGDSGWGIASKFSLDFNTQLSVWNPSVNWNTLQIGQVVCISAPGSSNPTTTQPTTTHATTTQAATTQPPTTTQAATTSAPGTCGGFNINSGRNFIGYWGQSSAGQEQSLGSYCTAGDTTFTAFHIAFMNNFGDPNVAGTIGMNLAGHCSTSCNNPTQPGLLCCPSIGTDIQTCQNQGKKILMSLGGAVQYGTYSLTDASGTALADFLWNNFLGGSTSTARPFGNVKLDGIDLDIENANSAGYLSLVNRLRQLYATDSSKTYYISGAPQCPYPDASLGPSSGTALSTGGGVTLDYIVVQHYNNGVCNTGASNFVASFNQWAGTSVSKVMVGFLGIAASGSGYVGSGTLISDLQQIWTNPKFGGVMSWDTGTVSTNTEGGSTSYAHTIANALASQFGCSSNTGGGNPTTTTQSQGGNSQGGCTKYIVVAGDTGYGIASKLGVDFPTQLSVWNPSVNWGTLAVGQQICGGPPGGTTVKPTAATTTSAPTTKAPTTAAPTTKAPQGGNSQGVAAWTPGVYYTAGTCVSYNGVTYKCVQPHTAQVGWEPVYVASLWTPSSSCQNSQQGQISTSDKTTQSWLVPLLVVIILLLVVLIVVFFKRNTDRSRSYSKDLALPEIHGTQPTSPTSPVSREDVVLTKASIPKSTSSPSNNWEKRADNNGQTYYYNNFTGVSQWEVPEGMV